MKRAILAALALAAAALIGRATVSTPPPTHTERVIEHRSVEPRIVQANGLTADDVRAIIDEKLASKPAAEAPALPADEAAFGRAQAALDLGLGDGKWTDEDRDRLQNSFVGLQPAQIRQLVKSLIATLNSGRVQVELVGAPV